MLAELVSVRPVFALGSALTGPDRADLGGTDQSEAPMVITKFILASEGEVSSRFMPILCVYIR